MSLIPIAVAFGDGIGPEIMQAALHILKEAGAPLDIHVVEIGEKVYLRGHPTGIEPATWDTLRRTKAFLKAPITTPQGGGFKSLNVTIRGSLGLYANVRPCVSYAPFVADKTSQNGRGDRARKRRGSFTRGLNTGKAQHVCQTLKIISREEVREKIVRYAFEYALP